MPIRPSWSSTPALAGVSSVYTRSGREGKNWRSRSIPWGRGSPLPSSGIHHRHVHRLAPDGLDGLRPCADRAPLESVGIQGAQTEEAFGGDGGEEQMSQNGP